MERASLALVETAYFEADMLCVKALEAALRAREFERMARICMPLQEARRQLRHEATDTGRVTLISAPFPAKFDPKPGCFLVCPPIVGVEARAVRERLARKKVPAMVLCREPTTKSGQWPVVAVGPDSEAWHMSPVVRVRVEAPENGTPDCAWLLRAQEALGDAAIAKVKPSWPADHRVEDLLEYLDAVPDHEKLAQALESACREAAVAPASVSPRRRGVDDPYSF